LPPLVVEKSWVKAIQKALPELPEAKRRRFVTEYKLSAYDANVLVAERGVAEYYEGAVTAAESADAKLIANWLTGNLFGLMNEAGSEIGDLLFGPDELAKLLDMLADGEINPGGAREALGEMFAKGGKAAKIVKARSLQQISDSKQLRIWAVKVLDENPQQVAEYLGGNAPLLNWFFGQAMQSAKGRANPNKLRAELENQLAKRNKEREKS
jgi:aspartyl-tRNA(Asn)/glutamyl-tRNA(Gln) amidotransferase subunit B